MNRERLSDRIMALTHLKTLQYILKKNARIVKTMESLSIYRQFRNIENV